MKLMTVTINKTKMNIDKAFMIAWLPGSIFGETEDRKVVKPLMNRSVMTTPRRINMRIVIQAN